MNRPSGGDDEVSGEFLTLAVERYYAIRSVDEMAPFFVSVVSAGDHWLLMSSTGGLTAGRVSPDTALFPYVTVDKIQDSSPHTGSNTLVRILEQEEPIEWDGSCAELARVTEECGCESALPACGGSRPIHPGAVSSTAAASCDIGFQFPLEATLAVTPSLTFGEVEIHGEIIIPAGAVPLPRLEISSAVISVFIETDVSDLTISLLEEPVP